MIWGGSHVNIGLETRLIVAVVCLQGLHAVETKSHAEIQGI